MKALPIILLACLILAFTLFSRGCCSDCQTNLDNALVTAAEDELQGDVNGLKVSREDFDVTLEGTVPNEQAAKDAEVALNERLPGGRVNNLLKWGGAAAATGVGIAAAIPDSEPVVTPPAPEPAPVPVPVPSKIAKLTIKPTGNAELDRALAAANTGVSVGDPLADNGGKFQNALAAIPGVETVSVDVAKSGDNDFELVASIVPVPAPEPKIAKLTIKPTGNAELDKALATTSTGVNIGDPLADNGGKFQSALAGVPGVEGVSVEVEEAGDNDFELVATITPKAMEAAIPEPTPTPEPMIAKLTIMPTGDEELDRALASRNTGVSIGDPLADNGGKFQSGLTDVPGVETVSVEVKESGDNDYELVATVTPKPEPKPDVVTKLAVLGDGVKVPRGRVEAALGLAEGDVFDAKKLEGAEMRLKALDGVAEAAVRTEAVDGGFRIIANLTAPTPAPAPVPTPPAPEPTPEPIKSEPKKSPEPIAAGLAGLADLPIYFRPGHVCVDASDIGKLRTAARLIKEAGNDDPISLIGFSDPSGSSEAANKKMALRRAAEVRNLLIEEGVNRSILTTSSGGIDPGDGTKESYEHSRRVEIRATR